MRVKKEINESLNKRSKKAKSFSVRTIPFFSSFRLIFVSFMFFVILSAVSFATECGLFGNYLYNGVCVPDYLVNLSTIIMLISVLIASAFYMIGIALEHERIKQWSKDLLFQILGSVLILGVYLGIAASLDFWAPSLLNTNLAYVGEPTVRSFSSANWVNLHDHVTHYVSCLISYTKGSVKNIVGITSAISILATTSINIQISDYNQFYSIFATGSGLSSLVSIAIGALASTLIQLRLQLEILNLNSALFSLILPLGLVFRSFPYTRSAGAAMIAITIGFTIFLPIFYLIIEDIGYHYYPKNVCLESPPSVSFFGLVGMGITIAKDGALAAVQKYFGQGGDFEGLIKIAVIQATLLPLIAYLVVLNITKRIAEILGGEIDFSTLVRLI